MEFSSIGELVSWVADRVESRRRIVWFRGHRRHDWELGATIWRDYRKEDERNFTNRFRSRASNRHQWLPTYDDCAHWLSLMQHYGLPTRLLDWSRSPLIAAYFAVEKYVYDRSSEPTDACIWALEPHALNVAEGFEKVTPPIDAHMCEEMLVPAFSHQARENGKVLAVMAAERDVRMFVQQGCFTIHSDQTALDQRKHHDEYLTKLTIPARYVRRLAFEIDVCGFRKGDMFPDLANLAEELKGTYKPTRSRPGPLPVTSVEARLEDVELAGEEALRHAESE
jgi:hypothetical protein